MGNVVKISKTIHNQGILIVEVILLSIKNDTHSRKEKPLLVLLKSPVQITESHYDFCSGLQFSWEWINSQ